MASRYQSTRIVIALATGAAVIAGTAALGRSVPGANATAADQVAAPAEMASTSPVTALVGAPLASRVSQAPVQAQVAVQAASSAPRPAAPQPAVPQATVQAQAKPAAPAPVPTRARRSRGS